MYKSSWVSKQQFGAQEQTGHYWFKKEIMSLGGEEVVWIWKEVKEGVNMTKAHWISQIISKNIIFKRSGNSGASL